MAQRTTVVLVDDLDGIEADETVGFGLDGVSYEIDLAGSHARALRDELAPYVEHARPVGRADRSGRAPSQPAAAPTEPPPARRRGGVTATVDREQNRAIREWSTRHGHPLAARGRIPAAVAEAFHRGDPSALAALDGGGRERVGSSTETASAPGAAAAEAVPATPEPSEPPAGTEVAVKRGPDGLTVEEREQVRAWALEEGIEVKARGRLTKDLIANYKAVQARR